MSILDADSGELVPDNATQPFGLWRDGALTMRQAVGRVLRQDQKSPKLQG